MIPISSHTPNLNTLIGHRLSEWVTIIPSNFDIWYSINGVLKKDILFAHWRLNETKFGGIH